MAKNTKFPPIYYKIKGQIGYKTEKEIIEHLKKERIKTSIKNIHYYFGT